MKPKGMTDAEYRICRRERDRRYIERRIAKGLLPRNRKPAPSGKILMAGHAERVSVPQSTWETADRLARAKAEQDAAGWMLGDPPRGFSALDRAVQ